MPDSGTTYDSPSSTTEWTPLRLHLIDSSTPWSDVVLEERSFRISSPPIPIGKFYLPNRSYRSRLRRYNRLMCLMVVVTFVALWLWLGGRPAPQQQRKIEKPYVANIEGLQFIRANNPHIRQFVGRWTSTSDGTRREGTFPGVYFDFTLNGTRTVLLSLHNADISDQIPVVVKSPIKSPNMAFLPSTNTSSAEPISLLVRVDDEEYIVLPNATSIVTVRKGNLDVRTHHTIRVIAPMVRDNVIETLQVNGLYIDQGGQLLPYDTTPSRLQEETATRELTTQSIPKMLEVVTDLPGSTTGRDKRRSIGTTRGILGGVMGWEYLLGEMFGTDHVTIGMDGMCLIQDCIGGRGSPAGLADVFFQSGPLGTEQYAHPWLFQEYVPDVMVINIGNSDWDSFQTHRDEYNKTTWDLTLDFEDTYVALVKAIRALAYPQYSATTAVDASRYIYSPTSAAGGLPIFVMRPFRGQLEQATHSVVERLRGEGDRSVFWLDTSGWLNTDVNLGGKAEEQDFFLDGESETKQWRLTERGNQRVAILLHLHVCRYLARDAEKCAFLPPEVYQGKTLNPDMERLDELMEDERERRLKRLFWD
ncbi:hypothetical protein LSUE1_G006151 [Lachnellula suecica]|uniref:Uncharacterized protein n=1 Tax=Lachnellula suecica TaxID=602035 RepID=A0A8T9BXL3_9HELO|nr:hypothetical protein LSUE1_G006151 [Lachnellula suecica]